MTRIGIMQGRLLAPEPGRIQAFPRLNWPSEFYLAAAVPLAYIEWIYDRYGADVNPLLTEDGVHALLQLAQKRNLPIRAICADWFMDFPFLRCTEDERRFRQDALIRLFTQAKLLNAVRIVLPLVDNSRISSSMEEEIIIQTIEGVYAAMDGSGIELHLESDLAPSLFAVLLNRVKHPLVKVNYDSGNSAALGFNVTEEFAAYGSRIGSVHIKDRRIGGSTVPLGSGGVDFKSLFKELELMQYSGDFTLQTARGSPGEETTLARHDLAFVRRYWPY